MYISKWYIPWYTTDAVIYGNNIEMKNVRKQKNPRSFKNQGRHSYLQLLFNKSVSL